MGNRARRIGRAMMLVLLPLAAACSGAPDEEHVGSSQEALRCPVGWTHDCEPGLGGKLVCVCEPPPDPPPPPPLVATEIVAGVQHSCALLSDATVRCWGESNGGPSPGATYPGPQVPILSGVAHIAGSAMSYGFCAILQDGTLQCFDSRRALAIRGRIDISTAQDPSLVNVRAVAVGERDACAIVDNGVVRCWGKGNIAGGDGFSAPTQLVAATGIAVSSLLLQGADVCAMTFGGVVCQGNEIYQGLGLYGMPIYNPTLLVGSDLLFCAISSDLPGVPQCWTGRPGWTPYATPQVPLVGIKSITTGWLQQLTTDVPNHAVDVGGVLWGWSALDPTHPQPILPPTSVATVANGDAHTCALTTGGQVYCWGDDSSGQLAGSSTTVPVTF